MPGQEHSWRSGADAAPDSGLGLFLGEGRDVLKSLQSVILQEQAREFVDAASKAPRPGESFDNLNPVGVGMSARSGAA